MLRVLIIISYTILSAAGLILFKTGTKSSQISMQFLNGVFTLKFAILSLIGVLSYIFSFLLYLWIISKYDLVYIYPLTVGLISIMVLLGGIFVLNESPSGMKILGSIIIIIGVILMNLPSQG